MTSVTIPVTAISSTDVCHSIGANENATAAVAHSVRLANTSSNGWGVQEEVTHTPDCTAGPAVQHAMQVRRLTPVECERLQGFPDGYTAIPWRKKPAIECPDGPRYKALGNSWAVPVVAWIGRRIEAHLRAQSGAETEPRGGHWRFSLENLMNPLRFGSVCSGIEAASVAWHPLGWRAAWLAEIEPFPSAVLAHHYPEVPNLGDMTALPERIMCGEVEAPDLFCGGTPCQAFSVAGLRRSLDDARGNLSLTFCEIANAIDVVRVRAGKPAAVIFWENVPGVLSTKDNAFGCFLAGLAGEVDPIEPPGKKWTNAGVVVGPQRAVAWRILDAQYFGVAQRRRRVFVVASARDGFDPAKVLFEFDGVRRDIAPSREAGETVTPTIRAGASNGGAGHGARSGDSKDELIVPVAHAPEIARCIATREGSSQDWETTTMVAHSLRGEGFDASEDGTGRGTPLVPVGVTIHGTDGTATVASYSDTAQCLRARTPGNIDNSSTTVVQHPIVFHPTQDPISSTDQAILVTDQHVQAWVPISQIDQIIEAPSGPMNTMTITAIVVPDWLAADKGLRVPAADDKTLPLF